MGLSVISLIVTVVGAILGAFGILFGLYTYVKSKKYPGQITFVKEDCISLVDSIIRNLPNLNITYNEKSISDRVVLLKGYLVNTGKIDIKREMINNPIILSLPEGYRWLEVKQVSSSSGIVADIHILSDNDRNIEFKFELLKREEFIQFEALAEVPDINEENKDKTEKPPSTILEKAIAFDSRISDTGKIERLDLELGYYKRRKRLMRIPIYGAIIVAFLSAIFLIFVYIYATPCEIQYEFSDGNGRIITTRISPQKDGTIKVKGVNNDYSKMFTPKDFFSRNDMQPRIVTDKRIVIPVILMWPITLFYIFAFLLLPRKQRKISKILNR
jgi:hypothetical protein